VALGGALIATLVLIGAGKAGGSLPLIGTARIAVGTALGSAERMASRLTRPAVEFLRSGLAGNTGSGQAAGLERQLVLMNPYATLDRGYSITYDEAGHVLSSVERVQAGDQLAIRMSDGIVGAQATSERTVSSHA